MMKRGSGPSGDAAAGAGSARSRSSKDGRRSSWRRKGGRPLQRQHWFASGGLCLLSSIKAETLTRDPYYADCSGSQQEDAD